MGLLRTLKRLRKKKEESTRKKRRKAHIEPLEQRVLLSADLKLVTTGSANDEELPQAAPESETSLAHQVFFLDFDGATDVSYEGPVRVEDVDVPGFDGPESLEGQKAEIIASVLDSLQDAFLDSGIVFTAEEPAVPGPYSTIYIGGEGSAFEEYGPFIGLSEKIDIGNADKSDIAFVFTDQIHASSQTPSEYGRDLAGYVAHEAGHLMGWQHAFQAEPDNPLSALGFKPYVHIEIAKDVRTDLLEDGKLTVAGADYDVNPLILEAVRKYPSYFYAGSVGPDGFPELVMGQTVLHPDSTGIWVSHILDKAWEVQNSSEYSPEEKLQALAWAYGFPMHAAADVWSHTLVNELAEGVWPDIKMALQHTDAMANILRHLLAEGYIGDATPGYDGVKTVLGHTQRTTLPDGDVSDVSTPIRELSVPTRFVYDALIEDLPRPHSRGVRPRQPGSLPVPVRRA